MTPRVPGEIGESSVSEGRRWESFRGDGGRGGIVTGKNSALGLCQGNRERIKIKAIGKTSSRSREHEEGGKDYEHAVFTVCRNRQVWDAVG